MSYIIPKRVLDELHYYPDLLKRLNESYPMESGRDIPADAESDAK